MDSNVKPTEPRLGNAEAPGTYIFVIAVDCRVKKKNPAIDNLIIVK